jgi:hypothetical protein
MNFKVGDKVKDLEVGDYGVVTKVTRVQVTVKYPENSHGYDTTGTYKGHEIRMIRKLSKLEQALK